MRTASLLRAAALLAAWSSACAAGQPTDRPAGPPPAGPRPRSPEGRWLTQDRGGVIAIAPCGSALCGTIAGISAWPAGGGVVRDVTGRPQCHMILLDRLVLRADGRWHGTVRDPEDGRVYTAEVWVPEDGALRLRGYVGLPLFGSTQIWPAFGGALSQDCHFRLAP